MTSLSRVIAVALVACASAVAAQSTPPAQNAKAPAYRFRLLGVYDGTSGDPIAGVEVIDVVTGTKAETSKDGIVSLFYLPDGGSLVRLRKIGYSTQTLAVSISPADTTPITIVLDHATQLAPVVITDSAPKYLSGALRGFEERKKQGFGYFVDEAEMRKNDNHSMASTIVGHIPGLIAVPAQRGSATYIASARKMCAGPTLGGCRSPNCVVTVYQDGVIMSGPIDVNRLQVSDYAAIEFYHGGAESPPQYNATRDGCGTLLLWTRER
jgi:hypothetical protein